MENLSIRTLEILEIALNSMLGVAEEFDKDDPNAITPQKYKQEYLRDDFLRQDVPEEAVASFIKILDITEDTTWYDLEKTWDKLHSDIIKREAEEKESQKLKSKYTNDGESKNLDELSR